MNTRPIFLFSLIALLFLQGCGTKPTTQPEPIASTATQTLTPEQTIAKAKAATDTRKASLYLQAATSYCKSQLFAQCHATLKEVTIKHLNNQEIRQYLILQLELSNIDNNLEYLISLSAQIPTEILQTLNPVYLKDLYTKLSQAYLQNEQPLQAAITLFENLGIFDENEHQTLIEEAWQLLRRVDINELIKYHYTGEDTNLIAWLDLAQTISLNQIDLDNQYSAYQSWKQLWPEHPGTTTPPTELELLNQLPALKPRVITLALPLTGNISEAGIAIRDGFFAQHYAATEKTITNQIQNDIEIRLFDTNSNDFLSLYDNPIEDNIIIGPLDKKLIAKLSELDELNTPTLVLNSFDNTKEWENIYQLSLAPETEAIQAAKYMNSNGYSKAALILPENNLGFRIHDAFVEAFSKEQGLVIDSSFYSDQATLAKTVSLLLGTEESKERQRKIRSITGENFVFYPRRRKDIDSIFMVAKPEIAKQLKPLFAFNYAAKLPVYSTSHIHKPNETTTNKDLDDIKFLDMPWMLIETIDIKQDMYQTLPAANQNYSRFHALGADAYSLVPRLTLLKEVKDSKMKGYSGVLHIDEQGAVHRDLTWATFKRGKINNIRE